MEDLFPRLRHLEPIPYEQDGQPLILLRDPQQVSPQVLAVSPQLCGLLPLLDGRRSLREIRERTQEASGREFPAEDLERIVRMLDDALFLDNPRFQQRHREVVEAYRRETVRTPYHAGGSYPGEPAPLAERLSQFYLDPCGAGLPASANGRPIRGLVAPHIDLRLGGPCYTHAYRALGESARPDLFVILGTGHHGLPEMFSLSEKDFSTPLGTATTDRGFLDLLRRHLGDPSLFQEDLSHRYEHTVEFQVVYLQHLFPNQDLRIVPVLVSFSYLDFQIREASQRSQRLFGQFLEALSKAEAQSGRKVCYIASVDLAHVGPRYGDEWIADEARTAEILRKDRELLACIERVDPTSFFGYVEEERDERRICGFSPLFTLLSLLQGGSGQILDHQKAQMDQHSFVSFASLVLR